MIVSHLLRLRRAPKSVRDRYALTVAATFTGVVALLWVVFLPGRFAPAPDADGGGANATPFASLLTGARTQLAAITGAFKRSTSTTTAPVNTVVAPSTVVQNFVTATSTIILSPEEVAEVKASVDSGPYQPATTSTTKAPASNGRVVQIVTTSSIGPTSTRQVVTSQPD